MKLTFSGAAKGAPQKDPVPHPRKACKVEHQAAQRSEALQPSSQASEAELHQGGHERRSDRHCPNWLELGCFAKDEVDSERSASGEALFRRLCSTHARAAPQADFGEAVHCLGNSEP